MWRGGVVLTGLWAGLAGYKLWLAIRDSGERWLDFWFTVLAVLVFAVATAIHYRRERRQRSTRQRT